MNFTPTTIRGMEIAGTIVIVLGLVFWYSTPTDVVVAPLMVLGVGAALAGIPWLLKRKQSDESVHELAQKLQSERENSERQN